MTYKYRYSDIGFFQIFVKEDRYLKMLRYFKEGKPKELWNENGYIHIDEFDLLRCIVSGIKSNNIEFFIENHGDKYIFYFRYEHTQIRKQTRDYYKTLAFDKLNSPAKTVWFIFKTTLEIKRLFREMRAKYKLVNRHDKLSFLWW